MAWLVLIAVVLGSTATARIQTGRRAKRLARSIIELYISFLRHCYSEAEFRDVYLAELSKINFEHSSISTASLTSLLDKRDTLRTYSASSRAQWEASIELVQRRPQFWLSHREVVNSAYHLVRKELLGRLPSDPILQFLPWGEAIRQQVEGETLLVSHQNALLRELDLLFTYRDAICESQKVFSSVGFMGPGRPPIPKALNGI